MPNDPGDTDSHSIDYDPIETEDMDYDDGSGDAEENHRRYLSFIMQAAMHVLHTVITVVNATTMALEAYSDTYYDKQPYHTSALSGAAWVTELLAGHPERIRCELGVHKHVFYTLINLLRQAGCRDSKHVLLEEQLAIFLYASVTGLSIRHLGERFQRSNETISKYVHYCFQLLPRILIYFQGISNGFFLHSLPRQYIQHMSGYLMQIALLPPKSLKTRSSSHSLQTLLVLLMVHTSHVILLVRIAILPGTARVTSLKTASPRAPSIYASPTC
jgi:hypothetical protein